MSYADKSIFLTFGFFVLAVMLYQICTGQLKGIGAATERSKSPVTFWVIAVVAVAGATAWLIVISRIKIAGE